MGRSDLLADHDRLNKHRTICLRIVICALLELANDTERGWETLDEVDILIVHTEILIMADENRHEQGKN